MSFQENNKEDDERQSQEVVLGEEEIAEEVEGWNDEIEEYVGEQV